MLIDKSNITTFPSKLSSVEQYEKRFTRQSEHDKVNTIYDKLINAIISDKSKFEQYEFLNQFIAEIFKKTIDIKCMNIKEKKGYVALLEMVNKGFSLMGNEDLLQSVVPTKIEPDFAICNFYNRLITSIKSELGENCDSLALQPIILMCKVD